MQSIKADGEESPHLMQTGKDQTKVAEALGEPFEPVDRHRIIEKIRLMAGREPPVLGSNNHEHGTRAMLSNGQTLSRQEDAETRHRTKLARTQESVENHANPHRKSNPEM